MDNTPVSHVAVGDKAMREMYWGADEVVGIHFGETFVYGRQVNKQRPFIPAFRDFASGDEEIYVGKSTVNKPYNTLIARVAIHWQNVTEVDLYVACLKNDDNGSLVEIWRSDVNTLSGTSDLEIQGVFRTDDYGTGDYIFRMYCTNKGSDGQLRATYLENVCYQG